MPGPGLSRRTSSTRRASRGSRSTSSPPPTTRSNGRFHHHRLARPWYVDDSIVECNVEGWIRSPRDIGNSSAGCVLGFVTTLHRTVVIGAGPYGLAAAAHLDRLGRPVTVLGRPM